MNPLTDASISRRRALFGLGLSPALLLSRRATAVQTPPAVEASKAIKLPLKEGSFRFAVMGDTGRGDRGQYEMAAQMAKTHKEFPFELMLMNGDNIYGADGASEMRRKFETPYKPLLDAGVKFQASLGNHDNPNQRFYKLFNMGGSRFYTFRPPKTENIRFFALDSNYVDKEQLDWLEKELSASQSDWKIAFFHHPLYSSGRTHGSALETRAAFEPLFIKHNVSAVFTGHEHFYERIKPQKGGIVHWVSGAGGSLRVGDIRQPSELTAKAFDTDYHFIICEIAADELFFQTISRAGNTIDSGVVQRSGVTSTVSPLGPTVPSETKPGVAPPAAVPAGPAPGGPAQPPAVAPKPVVSPTPVS